MSFHVVNSLKLPESFSLAKRILLAASFSSEELCNPKFHWCKFQLLHFFPREIQNQLVPGAQSAAKRRPRFHAMMDRWHRWHLPSDRMRAGWCRTLANSENSDFNSSSFGVLSVPYHYLWLLAHSGCCL